MLLVFLTFAYVCSVALKDEYNVKFNDLPSEMKANVISYLPMKDLITSNSVSKDFINIIPFAHLLKLKRDKNDIFDVLNVPYIYSGISELAINLIKQRSYSQEILTMIYFKCAMLKLNPCTNLILTKLINVYRPCLYWLNQEFHSEPEILLITSNFNEKLTELQKKRLYVRCMNYGYYLCGKSLLNSVNQHTIDVAKNYNDLGIALIHGPQEFDINSLVIDYKAPFHYGLMHKAIMSQSIPRLEELVQAGADIDIQIHGTIFKYSPLVCSIIYFGEKFKVFEFLFHKRANLDSVSNYGDTALHLIARKPHYLMDIYMPFVELLLSGHANLNLFNQDGFTPLMLAVFTDNILLVQKFLNHKAMVTIKSYHKDHRNALDLAAFIGNLDICETLLQSPDVTIKDKSIAIFHAIPKGNIEVVKFFIKNGVPLNTKNKNGNSLLHISRLHGQDRMYRFLIDELHIDTSIRNNDGLFASQLDIYDNSEYEYLTKVKPIYEGYRWLRSIYHFPGDVSRWVANYSR